MLHNRDFTLLFLGRLISNFGDSVYGIGTMLLVYSLSHSPFYTGFALFLTSSTALIQVLLSPLMDHLNPKKYLIVSQLVQALLLISIPILNAYGYLNLGWLFATMFAVSLLNQMVYPIQLSLLPKILNKEELVDGNAYFTMPYQGSDALFNALAGVIITAFGIFAIYIVDSATFLINGIMFIFLSQQLMRMNQNKSFNQQSFLKSHFTSLYKGLALWKDHLLFPLLVGVIVINFSVSGIFANLPFYAVNPLHYSLLMSTSGIGILAGAFIARLQFIRKWHLGKFYIIGIALIGLCWMISALIEAHNIYNQLLTFILFLIGWMVVGIFNIFSQTIVQLKVNADQLGMAMGSMIGVSTSLAPIGALLGGTIGNILNSHFVIILFASLFIGVALFWLSQTSIRKMSHLNTIE
ncbi:MFS transporter [Staphylococcus lutrae]|uniref:MFS transporter n=1 Tax=Staphylococcus lutrae TaxID=155085 RepID=UPI00146D25AD|nr:MFS transporter [Staphylococcus lutrae]